MNDFRNKVDSYQYSIWSHLRQFDSFSRDGRRNNIQANIDDPIFDVEGLLIMGIEETLELDVLFVERRGQITTTRARRKQRIVKNARSLPWLTL